MANNFTLKTLKSKIPSRHGSETHGRKLARKGKEKFAFSDRDRRRVALWYAEGLSYREIEVISHFIPANGMDAYRQINFILKKDETFCHKFIERAQANNRPLPEEAKAPRYCEA